MGREVAVDRLTCDAKGLSDLRHTHGPALVDGASCHSDDASDRFIVIDWDVARPAMPSHGVIVAQSPLES